ncbi:DUF2782 domain-containing protein [Hydrogenophaga sp.]|jgi:hypothetical protein|uniref:DUF2782 domain-containing protein n=1 Tax=Hydrogenophaga sp. TaxID=1904254 RepID=UPI003F6F8BA2
MTPNLRRSLAALALGGCATLTALAQVAPVAPTESPREPGSPRDRIERITHEDSLTRIDELRVGGQTQSIDVQPKNGAPAYQIQPEGAGSTDSSGKRTGNAGRSSWRVLNF